MTGLELRWWLFNPWNSHPIGPSAEDAPLTQLAATAKSLDMEKDALGSVLAIRLILTFCIHTTTLSTLVAWIPSYKSLNTVEPQGYGSSFMLLLHLQLPVLHSPPPFPQFHSPCCHSLPFLLLSAPKRRNHIRTFSCLWLHKDRLVVPSSGYCTK